MASEGPTSASTDTAANKVQLHAVDLNNKTGMEISIQNVGKLGKDASKIVENEFVSWVIFDGKTLNADRSVSVKGGVANFKKINIVPGGVVLDSPHDPNLLVNFLQK